MRNNLQPGMISGGITKEENQKENSNDSQLDQSITSSHHSQDQETCEGQGEISAPGED